MKKKQRKHAQDFSEASCGRITDSSFAPACNVNAIVRHYENSGIDPYADRRGLAAPSGAEASTLTFEEAMRNKADLDSAFNEQPASVRAAHANAFAWAEHLDTPQPPAEPPEASPTPPVEPSAPQGSSQDES